MISEVLQRVARVLDAARMPYMIIGGQAVLVHGEPRLTKDIDVTLGVALDRLGEVLRLVEAAGLQPLVDPETFVRETMVLPCTDTASRVRVDLVFSESGFERDAIRRAATVRIGAVDVRVICPEDLVVQKVVAGRPRDLEDVRSLLARQPGLDRRQVETLLRQFEQVLELPLMERWREACRDD